MSARTRPMAPGCRAHAAWTGSADFVEVLKRSRRRAEVGHAGQRDCREIKHIEGVASRSCASARSASQSPARRAERSVETALRCTAARATSWVNAVRRARTGSGPWPGCDGAAGHCTDGATRGRGTAVRWRTLMPGPPSGTTAGGQGIHRREPAGWCYLRMDVATRSRETALGSRVSAATAEAPQPAFNAARRIPKTQDNRSDSSARSRRWTARGRARSIRMDGWCPATQGDVGCALCVCARCRAASGSNAAAGR